MKKTLENYEKPKFGPDFDAFGPIWAPRFFFLSFTSTSI